MLTRFAIEVTTITSRGEYSFADTAYVVEYNEVYDRLHTDNIPRITWASEQDAINYIEELPVARVGKFTKSHTYEVEAIDYTHANHNGYSDTTPFEIVRAVSDKTIELRSMTAERAADWKPKIVAGGYAGHCTNNSNQSKAWVIKSDPEGYTVRARLQKDGSWKSSHGRHSLHTAAIKKYDYNF